MVLIILTLLSIEFDLEHKARETAIQHRLIDIRKAQIEYKNRHGRHAANFDELGKFLKEEKLPFVVKESVLSDEQLDYLRLSQGGSAYNAPVDQWATLDLQDMLMIRVL